MPAADAQQAVNAMLERQAGQIARMDLAARKRLYPILVESRRRLLDELTALPIQKYGTQHYRVALARVQAGIAALEKDFVDGLRLSADPAFALADKHLREQIATYSAKFEGSVRQTSWAPALAVDDEVLLTRYQASVNTYGSSLIQRVQQELALGIATETPWSELVKKIAGQDGILAQDYYGMNSKESHRQSRAERIVRTELSWAYNRAHHTNLTRANEEDPGYQKTLWATFDPRTGDDSRFVHKQVREIDEPFEDNQGRVYMHPPNRPNDREVEVPTRAEWRGYAPTPAPLPEQKQPEPLPLPTPKPLPAPTPEPKPDKRKQGAKKSKQAPYSPPDDITAKQFDQLDEQMFMWSQNLAAGEGFPENAREVLRGYTHRDYRKIRHAQAGIIKDDDHLNRARIIEETIASAPIVRDVAVWRGLTTGVLRDPVREIPLKIGASWAEKSLMSASIEIDVGLDFSDESTILMRIKPRSARAIWRASTQHREREVLFPSGTKLTIVGIDRSATIERNGQKYNRILVDVVEE